MTRPFLALICSFLLIPAAHAQKNRDPEQEKRHDEDNRIENAAERLTRPVETERDRFLKETSKMKPVDPANEAAKSETDVIFDRLTSGAPEWTYDFARQRGCRDLFERVATRLSLAVPVVTRQQFQTYAASYLRPESSPPYRSPADDEDRAFRELDRNQDGSLDANEATLTLREAAVTVDRNRDGLIDRAEYTGYFTARVDVMARKMQQNQLAREAKEAEKMGLAPPAPVPQAAPQPATKAAASTPSSKTTAVEAIRFGHLPRGLPEWFASLDIDRDGQIGLHEWRRSERALEEFEPLDENTDGLVTSDEWLRFSRMHPEEAARYVPQPSNGSRGMSPVSMKMR